MSEPHFNEKTILVTSTWDYVDLWLKRNHQNKAQFFWQQAQHFYHATSALPKNSSPLTAYYCMLNATKALLLAKNIQFGEQHGVSGWQRAGHIYLSNEMVKFKRGGILGALCQHLGETANDDEHSLQHLLYNLPYIHRAYDLSFSSAPELFVPIKNPRIVRSRTTNEAWFSAELSRRYANQNTITRLSNIYEQDQSIADRFIIRSTRRFNWIPSRKSQNLQRYKHYHNNLRKDLFYIYSPQRLWYIKRNSSVEGFVPRSSITITFAAMHKLSEMARYSPDRLARHFEGRYNWLLSEFISLALHQFVDEISSELTGYELMPPGIVS